jgi:molecular chaperone DnaJ
MYDSHGHAAFDSSGFSTQHMDPEEILRHFGFGGFGGFGGGGGGPQRHSQGADIEVPIRLTFQEAAFGCEKKVEFTADQRCASCNGEGAEAGSTLTTCHTCDGTGAQIVQNGFFTIQTECHACDGRGRVHSKPCRPCSGAGIRKAPKTVNVKIPAGVNSGNNIRLVGQGAAGERGGPPGNLFIRVTALPDRDGVFRRDGNDVHVDVPLSLSEAVNGAEVKVPTLGGSARVKLPPGTQSGEKRVLRNRGVPFVNRSKTGHQYLHFFVEIPKAADLTEAQQAALEGFAMDEEPPARDPKNWKSAPKSTRSGTSSSSSQSSGGGGADSFFKKMFGGAR